MNKLARTKLGTTMMKPTEAAQLPRDKTRCPHTFLVSGCVIFHQKYHVHPKLSKKSDVEKYQVPQVWSQLTHAADQVNPKKPQVECHLSVGIMLRPTVHPTC